MSTWFDPPPASEAHIQALVSSSPFPLPNTYLDYLRKSNGGEGDLAIDPWWLAIWPAEDVLENNASYQVSQNLPSFLGFATNGGGELIAFDFRAPGPPPIVMVPFIPMVAAEAVTMAQSFEELRNSFGSSGTLQDG